MATAHIIKLADTYTKWLVQGTSCGKSYRVVTYPGSTLLHIVDAKTNHTVGTTRAPQLVAEIREAIKKATQP